MGKIGGSSSWLTVVKRAFRSPTKEANEKRSSRRREEHEADEEEKVTFFRGFIFIRERAFFFSFIGVQCCILFFLISFWDFAEERKTEMDFQEAAESAGKCYTTL